MLWGRAPSLSALELVKLEAKKKRLKTRDGRGGPESIMRNRSVLSRPALLQRADVGQPTSLTPDDGETDEVALALIDSSDCTICWWKWWTGAHRQRRWSQRNGADASPIMMVLQARFRKIRTRRQTDGAEFLSGKLEIRADYWWKGFSRLRGRFPLKFIFWHQFDLEMSKDTLCRKTYMLKSQKYFIDLWVSF